MILNAFGERSGVPLEIISRCRMEIGNTSDEHLSTHSIASEIREWGRVEKGLVTPFEQVLAVAAEVQEHNHGGDGKHQPCVHTYTTGSILFSPHCGRARIYYIVYIMSTCMDIPELLA